MADWRLWWAPLAVGLIGVAVGVLLLAYGSFDEPTWFMVASVVVIFVDLVVFLGLHLLGVQGRPLRLVLPAGVLTSTTLLVIGLLKAGVFWRLLLYAAVVQLCVFALWALWSLFDRLRR